MASVSTVVETETAPFFSDLQGARERNTSV